MTNIVIIVAMSAHIFYLLFYFFEKNDFYVVVNSISVVLYIIAFDYNRRGIYRISADILSVELICYAVISTCVSGWLIGTQWYMILVVMSHYLFLKSTSLQKTVYTAAVFIALNFIVFWQLSIGPSITETHSDFLMFFNINVLLFSLLLILNIVSISDMLIKESYQTALDTATLETFTDPLTKIFNRRYMDKIKPEITREAAAGRKVLAALLDIDKFKNINDKCGHAFGDYVLTRVVGMMTEIFRSEDAFIRYGGEEFLIIMKDVTEENAVNAIERLRRCMRSREIEKDGISAMVTFTCGVSEFKTTLEETVEVADKRLYFGKNTGRDKTVSSQNIESNPESNPESKPESNPKEKT